jgi:Leucine-rich repeat (LRR) protein
LNTLEHLSLSQTQITGGLEHLQNLPRLRTLELQSTNIDDTELRKVLHLSLEEIDLAYTRVTNAGAASLASCKTLRRISLDPKNISTEVAEQLLDAIPGVRIDFDGIQFDDPRPRTVGAIPSTVSSRP